MQFPEGTFSGKAASTDIVGSSAQAYLKAVNKVLQRMPDRRTHRQRLKERPMRARIAVLPGDGIGPEVTREAVACLGQVARANGHDFSFQSHPIGGYALDAYGVPLPAGHPGGLPRPRTRSCWGRWATPGTTSSPPGSSPKAASWPCARAWAPTPTCARRCCTRPWPPPRR